MRPKLIAPLNKKTPAKAKAGAMCLLLLFNRLLDHRLCLGHIGVVR